MRIDCHSFYATSVYHINDRIIRARIALKVALLTSCIDYST